jgi:curli production assembly/transport component CsgF
MLVLNKTVLHCVKNDLMNKQPLFAVVLLLLSGLSDAGPLVYYPTNPSFGGNPGYGSVLLGEAQAQDQHKAPVAAKNPDSALNSFNQRLQTALINRLSSNIISSVVSGSGKIQTGLIDTGNFTVNVEDIGNGLLNITTTSKLTGQVQSFQYDQTAADGL